jgi:hypothetical protein
MKLTMAVAVNDPGMQAASTSGAAGFPLSWFDASIRARAVNLRQALTGSPKA